LVNNTYARVGIEVMNKYLFKVALETCIHPVMTTKTSMLNRAAAVYAVTIVIQKPIYE